ncbi:hypothetical protein MANES_03G204733v8 [Manihot esculenta]|uniref:Uncharacterized protein n=1 Tax=Manihot esculenta TaxID=3983 RepID=A0A2C9WBT6_MANES|nr:hypothetical protein MANES_03G204733v8 [Manihot esculenta]
MSSCHVRFLYLMMLIIACWNLRIQSGSSRKFLQPSDKNNNPSTILSKNLQKSYPSQRKLLIHDSCTNRDISISQSRDFTSGIPQYIVQIANTCVSGCAPSDIHLHCGWFASARMVNPTTFKRLSYDDCLVNAGKPLNKSQIIRFTYSNSFMYTLAFKSAKFCQV